MLDRPCLFSFSKKAILDILFSDPGHRSVLLKKMFIRAMSLIKPSLEDWVVMGKDWHRTILHGKGRETPQQLASIVLTREPMGM